MLCQTSAETDWMFVTAARARRPDGSAPRTSATACAPTGASRTTKRSTGAPSTSTDTATTCGPKAPSPAPLKTNSKSPFRYSIYLFIYFLPHSSRFLFFKFHRFRLFSRRCCHWNWVFHLQSLPCGSSGVACSKSITMRIGSPGTEEVIVLSRHKSTPAGKFSQRYRVSLQSAFSLHSSSHPHLLFCFVMFLFFWSNFGNFLIKFWQFFDQILAIFYQILAMFFFFVSNNWFHFNWLEIRTWVLFHFRSATLPAGNGLTDWFHWRVIGWWWGMLACSFSSRSLIWDWSFSGITAPAPTSDSIPNGRVS